MKKLLQLFCFTTAFVFAESESLWDYHPLHLGGNFISIASADVDAPQGGTLSYSKANGYLTMLVPVARHSFFFPRVEWNTFKLHWDQNPRFNKDRFYFLQFGLTFYSTGLEKWRWIARLDYNIDIEHFNNEYGLYNGLIWGAYEIHRKWHYHVGVLGYTGFEGENIYPVIGVDFAPNDLWLFQAIFPIDYSIQYKIGKYFRLSAKARPLRERFRVGKNEPDPQAVFNYTTTGAELNVHFEIERRFEFEIYGGYNFGGDFYIKNRRGHNALYTHVKSAPYGGANLDYAF